MFSADALGGKLSSSACGLGSPSDVTILRLPKSDLPRVPPRLPPKGRWPPSSRCGGTLPGVVEITFDSARRIISSIESP